MLTRFMIFFETVNPLRRWNAFTDVANDECPNRLKMFTLVIWLKIKCATYTGTSTYYSSSLESYVTVKLEAICWCHSSLTLQAEEDARVPGSEPLGIEQVVVLAGGHGRSCRRRRGRILL